MKSNIIKTYLWAALLSVMPLMVSAQADKPAADKKANEVVKKPKTFEAFCDKNTKTIEGTFNIYRKANNVYLEITEDKLGKEMLASGIIVKGPWVGTASAITDIVTFTKGNEYNLDIQKVSCTDKAEGELAEAVRNSNMPTVMHKYPIAAYTKDKKGYIIDITKDVQTTGKLFAFPNLQWVNRPVAERSGLDSIYVVNNGVKFECMHTQTDFMPALMMGGVGYDKHNTVIIEWALQMMPEVTMAMRKADKRVGFTALNYNDYDIDPSRTRTVNYIRRWNLQPKKEDIDSYRAGKLVEPENPIKVYLDTTFCAEMRKAAIRGVEEWNKCFEKAGFRNALVVADGMPETSFAYHQIVLSYAIVLSRLQTVTDPRTGEIVCATGSVSDNDIGKRVKDVQLNLGTVYPGVFTTDLPVVREELCRFQTAELMGQILGLVPNLGGSMAYSVEQLRNADWLKNHGISSSVTDPMAFVYFVQPGDNIPLRNIFSRVSEYDKWAIEWAYRLYPGMDADAEKSQLSRIAARAAGNPALRFVPASKKGYMASKTDLSSDKLKAAELGMKNLQRMLPKLESVINAQDDEDAWYKYWEYAPAIYANNSLYVMQALDFIGSITAEPVIAGYNEEPFSVASKEMQQRAMQFICSHAFQSKPQWMNNPTMEKIAGYNGDEIMRLLGNNIALRLTSSDVLSGLMEAQMRLGDKAYTIDDLDRAIDKYVFLDYSASKPVNRLQIHAQYSFVRQYLDLFKKVRDGKMTDAVALHQADRMRTVARHLERLSRTHANADARSHYRGLLVYLTHRVNAKTETAAPAVAKK